MFNELEDLEKEYHIRPARMDDAQAVADLFIFSLKSKKKAAQK